MQSQGALPGQWPGAAMNDYDDFPITMTATSGPVDPYLWPARHPSSTSTPSPSEYQPPPPPPPPPQDTSRAARPQLHSDGRHMLNNARSTPLLPTRPAGTVKHMANKFEAAAPRNPPPQLNVRTSRDRYRHPRSPPKSPTKDGVRKLQKNRPGGARSPTKSPATSFGTDRSFGSTSTVGSTKSQPHAAFSPQKHRPRPNANPAPLFGEVPLFGEITADGRWNGNFDLGNYGPLPTFTSVHQRRSSDGGVVLGHGRSRSHQENFQPATASALSPPHSHAFGHNRSRSDVQTPGMMARNIYHQPQQHQQQPQPQYNPAMYPTPPNSGTRNPVRKDSPTSRLPVSSQRPSKGSSASSSNPQSRSTSAMSNPAGRTRLSKNQPGSKEDLKSSAIPRNRYPPRAFTPPANGQSVSCKIVSPPPQTSPPLRSSRPRQPVSSATTAASRARAADRFQVQVPTDRRRPSEQWLGQPYDAQKERSKRRIPELGKIDFQARRDRIQKAISQNLEENTSQESLRKPRSSRHLPQEQETRGDTPTDAGAPNVEDQDQAEKVEDERDTMPGEWPTPGALGVDTFNLPGSRGLDSEPQTAHTTHTEDTEFEVDESPAVDKQSTEGAKQEESTGEQPPLLTSATYQKPTKGPTPISPVQEAPVEEVQSSTLLENVMQEREQNDSQAGGSGTEYVDNRPQGSTEVTASDPADRWGLGNGLKSVGGSIKIMLDGDRSDGSYHPQQSWFQTVHNQLNDVNPHELAQAQYLNEQAYSANGITHSPVSDSAEFPEDQRQATPRRDDSARENTLKASEIQSVRADEDVNPDVASVLEQYQSQGTVTPDMLQKMQKHMVDLQRMSANEGSNGFMIQNLLDSILDIQNQQRDEPEDHAKNATPSNSYNLPAVTPDTPPGWQMSNGGGTAFVYSNGARDEASPRVDGEDVDFHVKIRKADETWEQQQRAPYLRLDHDEDMRPAPPPKDSGYTPRSAKDVGYTSRSVTEASNGSPRLNPMAGLRISTGGQLDFSEFGLLDEGSQTKQMEEQTPERSDSAPPQPSHAPPPPPPASASASSTGLSLGMTEVPPAQTQSERGSREMSPRARKSIWAATGSSRPSMDSQRPPLPGSVSMTSFTDSTMKTSLDTGGDSQSRSVKGASPSPEHKRLQKRRHIVKELLDTENSYHQDLKIIEDIYKATAVPDLISSEDKKTLFGNCDEVERFSLHFYDELRRAVAPIYMPAKKGWSNKRGSFSTTQSDGTTQTSATNLDIVDDEKDRASTIGQAFLQNLHRMELVYSFYLKNHDAANQRLSALRATPTVKCWLDECHNNANDITSAWDLDSLLVKPTQRVAKYPMLLQQLLETTPQDHPDRQALSSAARDSISMLTRINDAKKRADLVDQIVNRKRKDSDVRSGIAKAFGRRTEKLKERVGIAEAFQDPNFDQLAHKFGGHFIRLQICMRDVQDYMNRAEKAMEQISNFAMALEFFTDVSSSTGSELESKWRKYGQAVREISTVAFGEHRDAVLKRVIGPMISCIKLHEGPQNAINNRKKRIVDYAKCKSVEKRGEKPDKKMVEASEMYIALNDQLKIELPKLYDLTANLVQGCLICFLEIQTTWYNTWERKLRPILEAADIPGSIQAIEPAFRADFDLVKNKLTEFGICNGAVLADVANFLSPSATQLDSETSSFKRPSTDKRAMSIGSDTSPMPGQYGFKRRSSGYGPGGPDALSFADGRMRSNSSLSTRGTPLPTPDSGVMGSRPVSNSNVANSSFGHSTGHSRPATANTPSSHHLAPRPSADQGRSPRPASGGTYFTARPGNDDTRFSGIFNSAMPVEQSDLSRAVSPKPMNDDTRVLFVCASLFEFSIDKTRKEGGYPYLTYVQGEVFDVVAQKGELWLAKNQDDSSNTLGWIWEQHFVILSQD